MTVQRHSRLVDVPLSRTVIYRDPSHKRFREGVLFVDTECDPKTNVLETIQLRYNGENMIYDAPFGEDVVKKIGDSWNNARVIVIHNAPFDLGQLCKLKGNSYNWVTEIGNRQDKYGESMTFSYCRMKLFGNVYKVKKLNRHSNFIRYEGKGVPVIDTLKLFSIFITDTRLKLKELAVDYLGREMIPYTRQNSLTRAYQLQDVEALDGLWCFFEDTRQEIDDVKDYSYDDLMKMDSTASCTKKEYLKRFPDIRKMRDYNDEQNELFGLTNPLEQAFLGGFTCALHHGAVKDFCCEDIKGSYDGVIRHENTDQYNQYRWEKIDPPNELPDNGCPILCKVWTNIVIRHMEDSLKVFKLRQKKDMYMWSYDKLALETIFGEEADIQITEAYKPIPLCNVSESLAVMWNAKKNWAEKEYGKGHPLRLYYKTLSNAAYGICAQRRHGRTPFTNMVKAGIITSRARLTLAKMIKAARDQGCRWIYSDTDSVMVALNGVDPEKLHKAMSEAIYPYECDCEFIGDIYINSLKRYVATNGVDLNGKKVEEKIKVHGIGPYNLGKETIRRMHEGEVINDELKISNLCATTALTEEMVMKASEKRIKDEDKSPFMFITDIPKNTTQYNWYQKYIRHCDTKMSVPEGATYKDEFERDFMIFETYEDAVEFFAKHKRNDLEAEEFFPIEDDEIDWDDEAMNTLPELYDLVVRESL